MPMLTDLEELAMEEGRQEGRQEGSLSSLQSSVQEALEVRFDRVPEGLLEAIAEICDEDKLRELHRFAIRCGSLEEFAGEL